MSTTIGFSDGTHESSTNISSEDNSNLHADLLVQTYENLKKITKFLEEYWNWDRELYDDTWGQMVETRRLLMCTLNIVDYDRWEKCLGLSEDSEGAQCLKKK